MGLLDNIVKSAVSGAVSGSSGNAGSALKKAATAAATAAVAKKAVGALTGNSGRNQGASESDVMNLVLRQLGGNAKSVNTSVLQNIIKSQMRNSASNGNIGDIAKSVISVIGMAGR